MPFDGGELDGVARVAAFRRHPTLAGLSWLLRHREEWPAGFRWDCAYPSSCAMGLAYRAVHGHRMVDFRGYREWVEGAFGLASWESCGLFYYRHVDRRGWRHPFLSVWSPMSLVYPGDVADAIDRYLGVG